MATPASCRLHPGRPSAHRAKTGRMMNMPKRRSAKIEASARLDWISAALMRAAEFTGWREWSEEISPAILADCPMETIRIRGARTHNLRNVNVDIPRNKLVVITGLSGSGKSSLAFDTLYAEGQRKYVESLSAYARQFLDQMQKPEVDFIEGLSPAIAIEQRSSGSSPRSIIATTTEIYDYLRLLYAHVGQPYCPDTGVPIVSQSTSDIVDKVLALPPRTRGMLLAPVVREQKGEFRDVIERLSREGFVRARVDGSLVELADGLRVKLDPKEKHTIEAVVDRLVIDEKIRVRLSDSVETALRWGEGVLLTLHQVPDSESKVQSLKPKV